MLVCILSRSHNENILDDRVKSNYGTWAICRAIRIVGPEQKAFNWKRDRTLLRRVYNTLMYTYIQTRVLGTCIMCYTTQTKFKKKFKYFSLQFVVYTYLLNIQYTYFNIILYTPLYVRI